MGIQRGFKPGISDDSSLIEWRGGGEVGPPTGAGAGAGAGIPPHVQVSLTGSNNSQTVGT